MAPLTRDDVATELEEHVLSGALPAGAKLPSERQLAVQFGVGRPLVREALRTLAERGLGEPRVARAGRRAHRRILDAVVARDAEAAQAAVDGHFSLRVGVFRELDQNLDTIARHALDRLFGPSVTLEGLLALADRGDE